MDKNLRDSMHSPKVSVVMSIYNSERYLQEAIDSILSQTFTDFELIIIDDGSTDSSAEILDSYKDTRIKRINNPQNLGLSRSLNLGIASARGEFIARMDSDDISLPERFDHQIKYLQEHDHIGILGTGSLRIDQFGQPIGLPWKPPESPGVINWLFCFCNQIGHPTVMGLRNVFIKSGGYNPDMLYAEDFDLWQRISEFSKLSNLQEVYVHRHIHDCNVSIKFHDIQKKNDILIRQRTISNLLGYRVDREDAIHLTTPSSGAAPKNSVRILIEMLNRYLKVNRLTQSEKILVRQDAAQRLIVISKSFRQDPYYWYIIFRAFWLNPKIIKIALKTLAR